MSTSSCEAVLDLQKSQAPFEFEAACGFRFPASSTQASTALFQPVAWRYQAAHDGDVVALADLLEDIFYLLVR